jgi:hypothetical protein
MLGKKKEAKEMMRFLRTEFLVFKFINKIKSYNHSNVFLLTYLINLLRYHQFLPFYLFS